MNRIPGSPVPASDGYKAPEVELNPPKSDLTLTLYTTVALNDGRYANNPWLQELPDPVSKACWDNYLSVSPADAASHGTGRRNGGKHGWNGSSGADSARTGQGNGFPGPGLWPDHGRKGWEMIWESMLFPG